MVEVRSEVHQLIVVLRKSRVHRWSSFNLGNRLVTVFMKLIDGIPDPSNPTSEANDPMSAQREEDEEAYGDGCNQDEEYQQNFPGGMAR